MRGTDGSEGRQLADEIRRDGNADFNFFDRELAGYTTSEKIASSFGTTSDGFDVEIEFEIDEIIVHADLLQGITQSYKSEREFIVASKERVVTIEQVRVYGKDWGKMF